MLELPKNWWERDCGQIACELYEASNGHVAFSTSYLRATLAFRENPKCPDVEQISPLDDYAWTVERVAYVFVPTLDDQAIEDCITLANSHTYIVYIAAPGQSQTLQSGLIVALKRRYPSVISFGEFISAHFTMAVHESADRSYMNHFGRLLNYYNYLVRKEFDGASLIVDPDKLYWADY